MLKRALFRTGLRGPRPIIISRFYYAAIPHGVASPTPSELKRAAREGIKLTSDEVSEISRREVAENPQSQNVRGGPGATAQSILTKQRRLDSTIADIAEKDVSEISERDLGRLQSAVVQGRRGRPVE
jgi:hypothetical protein